MKLKSASILIALTIILLCFPSSTEASSIQMKEEAAVSREEADKVAASFLERHSFSEPFSTVTAVEAVYGLNEEMFAYYYKFDNQYVLVAADKSYSPVLAAGEGALETAKIASGDRLYYLGGVQAVEASSAHEIQTQNARTAEQASGPAESILAKNPDAATAWNAYLSAPIATPGLLKMTEKKITLRTFDQYKTGVEHPGSACGPTTMAAISEYWRSYRGFGLLPSITYYGSEAATINHFYDEHGGTALGMSVNKVKKGLADHNGDFYRSATASEITGSYGSYRSEINASRPVAVKFDTKFTFFEPDWDYAYNYHWTVGKGYAFDTFDSMIIVNDNTGGSNKQEHYIDYPTNQPILSMVSFSM